MNLTKQQKEFLRRLCGDKIWISILDEIKASYEVPAWRPSERKHKKSRWVHESGKNYAAKEIAETLGLEHE